MLTRAGQQIHNEHGGIVVGRHQPAPMGHRLGEPSVSEMLGVHHPGFEIHRTDANSRMVGPHEGSGDD